MVGASSSVHWCHACLAVDIISSNWLQPQGVVLGRQPPIRIIKCLSCADDAEFAKEHLVLL